MDVKVGDILIRTRHGRSTVEVVRVGRKYFYVKVHGIERAYRLDNGFSTDYISAANGDQVWTPEALAESDERRLLLDRLRDLDWRPADSARRPKVSNEVLAKMIQLLEEALS